MPELCGLPIVDARSLPRELRALLRPGDSLRDRDGREHELPRWFLEVDSWETALATPLAPHFQLWEFMTIDVREAERVRQQFPRYVPCAVAMVAAALETFRQAAGSYVHIAANGGYRSPAHRATAGAPRSTFTASATTGWTAARSSRSTEPLRVRRCPPRGSARTAPVWGLPTTTCISISAI